MEPLTLEYFAGLFDGEGSVSILRSRSKGKLYHKLVVQLAMCNQALVENIHATFGGLLYKEPRATKCGKSVYKWMLQSHKALDLLLKLQPYLRCKEVLVPVAVEFQSTVGTAYKNKRHALLPETWERREQIRQEMKAINARD